MRSYDSTTVRWCYFDPKLTLFALFSVVLITGDLGSDSFQSYVYIENGNTNWGYSTITIVFVPFATVFVSEVLVLLIKKCRGETVTKQNMIESLQTIFRHFPLIQPFIHLIYLRDLKAARDQMKRSMMFHKSLLKKTSKVVKSDLEFDMIEDINNENLKDYQDDVKQAAEDYAKAKFNFLKIMTEFQKMKLYETFGESAPQAALQIGIVLQVGTVSPTQIFTICTSLFSLTLGASEILLMMATKDKPVKEASWKATWLLVFPAMFLVVVPRILTLSLIMAYTKGYFLLFVVAFFVINLLINLDHLRRDPSEVMVGILTNLFASCIVIQEGSGFYKRSGIASSFLHALGLLCLFFLMLGNTISTCPDTSINRHSPILHCFQMKFPTNNGMVRCDWPTNLDRSNCTLAFNSISKSYFDTLQCEPHLLTLETSLNSKFMYLTYFVIIEYIYKYL